MVMTPRIYAADAIFDQLESNFNLANPNANRNATTSAQDIVEKYKNADSGENVSGKITEKYVGKAESANLNLGKYGAGNSNESVMKMPHPMESPLVAPYNCRVCLEGQSIQTIPRKGQSCSLGMLMATLV